MTDKPAETALPAGSELLIPADAVRQAVARVAVEITAALGGQRPLVLAIMRGSVVFAGHLLPMLPFELDFDYIDATRYGGATRGGEIEWRMDVPVSVRNRLVLIVDDILDEGRTLAAVRDRLLAAGAGQVRIAVFADKMISGRKPIAADFTGVRVPDRYVFGFGMDVQGLWRNLPAVYALKPEKQN